MRRKILIMALTVVAVAMLAAPVLAIGPENAIGKNEKVGAMQGSCYLENSNGIFHEWIPEVPINPELSAIMISKDAGEFQMKNAVVVTNPAQVLQTENQWLYLSQSMLFNFYVFVGVPPNVAAGLVADDQDGIYMKRNVIG